MNKVYMVGTGPGAPAYLTPEAQQAIEAASIVVGWDFNFLPVKALMAGKKVFLQDAGNYIRVAEEAAEESRKHGGAVAILRIGDPCLSGGLARLIKVFKDFEVKIIPGVSSVQMAAAAARINLDRSVIFSFHESDQEPEEKRRFMLDAFERKRHLIILTGQEQKPDATASFLIKNGLSPGTPALVCENLTLKNEKIFTGMLKDITTQQFSWLSVMVVKQGATK